MSAIVALTVGGVLAAGQIQQSARQGMSVTVTK